MTAAITFYLVIKALHVMAAFAAYGLPFAYPFVIPYLRRNHPRTLPGVHDVQHRLSIALTGPGTVALFAFGVYMASKDDLWGESWVMVGVTILAIIAIAGGGIVKWTKELLRAGPRRHRRRRRRGGLQRRVRPRLPALPDHRGDPRRARPGRDLLHGGQALAVVGRP